MLSVSMETHNIIMISEGSCDTEDWCNDAEKSQNIYLYIIKYLIYSNKKIF